MFTAATHYRYVAEAVWLPSYVAVGALVLGNINDSMIAAFALFIALVASRIVLEFVCRFVFGDVRLQWRVGVIAFVSQLVLWESLWVWYAQERAA